MLRLLEWHFHVSLVYIPLSLVISPHVWPTSHHSSREWVHIKGRMLIYGRIFASYKWDLFCVSSDVSSNWYDTSSDIIFCMLSQCSWSIIKGSIMATPRSSEPGSIIVLPSRRRADLIVAISHESWGFGWVYKCNCVFGLLKISSAFSIALIFCLILVHSEYLYWWILCLAQFSLMMLIMYPFLCRVWRRM